MEYFLVKTFWEFWRTSFQSDNSIIDICEIKTILNNITIFNLSLLNDRIHAINCIIRSLFITLIILIIIILIFYLDTILSMIYLYFPISICQFII